jgi:hypothetical protein
MEGGATLTCILIMWEARLVDQNIKKRSKVHVYIYYIHVRVTPSQF